MRFSNMNDVKNKDYGKYILNKLLDKYEKSSYYGQPDQMKRGVFFYFRPRYLADYFIERTAEYKLRINADCRQLEEKGFISISWVKFEEGNIIDKVSLNLERINAIYEYLGRESLWSKEERLLGVIKEYRQDNPEWLGSFYDYLTRKLQQHTSPVYLEVDRPELATQVFTVLNAIADLEVETPIRLFSLEHLGDSKLFYKLQHKVIRVLRDFNPTLDSELTDNELLAETGLVPNPDYLYLSGMLEFITCGSIINVADFKPDLGLPVEMLTEIRISDLKVDYILTIENLTPYHEYIRQNKQDLNGNKNKGLVIYLGGFHNRWRQQILVTLKKYVSQKRLNIPFYHWGDIDYGGFMILKHLREKTGIEFLPYWMDIQTLDKFHKHCQDINEQAYLDRLEKLLYDLTLEDVKQVIQYMLENKIRLEQEAILL